MKSSAVLISRNTHQVIAEPCFQHLTDALLCFPRLSGVVIKIRNVQRRFVRHRELAYITRMVGQFCVECIFAPSQRFGESAVKVGDELLVSSHKADEVGYIVWHVPAVNPAVVFSIILTGSHASGETVVEWLNPLSFLIFRMEESGFFIVEIPVVIRTLQIVICFVLLA